MTFEPVLYTIARHLDLGRLRLYWLADIYYTYIDGQSWMLKSCEHIAHFNFELCLNFDRAPEKSWALNRLDCVQFREAMKQRRGPKFSGLQQRVPFQGEA
jgi:hypothetical protein